MMTMTGAQLIIHLLERQGEPFADEPPSRNETIQLPKQDGRVRNLIVLEAVSSQAPSATLLRFHSSFHRGRPERVSAKELSFLRDA